MTHTHDPARIYARMLAKVKSGEYPNERAWCDAVLKSKDSRVPASFKMFALTHMVRINSRTTPGSTRWAQALRSRHEAGEVLCQAQIDAYKRALGLTDDVLGDEGQEGREPGPDRRRHEEDGGAGVRAGSAPGFTCGVETTVDLGGSEGRIEAAIAEEVDH